MNDDTIAAIATPIGTAGIGVIRISGNKSLDIASKIFSGKKGNVKEFPTHTAHFGNLINISTSEIIDSVVLTVFKSPNSYTGEDVVEISCHGGYSVLKEALNNVLASGCRLAEPGEFTKRAFLNGKLDLIQAEAVNDIIKATTDGARKSALFQLKGGLSEEVGKIRSVLMGILASIEAAIDFPDDVDDPDLDDLNLQIETAIKSINSLLKTFDRSKIFREGLRIVITGKVNVGKSSLLNALLREERAIVTDIAGTTRDKIEENLDIRGLPVVAVDTAGLRSTSDPVEKVGIKLTYDAIKTADIILLVADISEGLLEDDIQIIEAYPEKPIIIVLNKLDLSEKQTDFHDILAKYTVVKTSTVTGDGIEELIDEIEKLYSCSNIDCGSAVVTNVRHQQELKNACESLIKMKETIAAGLPMDFLSVDINAALNYLGNITGETASEDLLDRIFSEFCIGK
ncbi:MAG: tRNA uridine-5-carboxymethylaminomethyl(34) synthesis GTPase MnmE [Armatimonadota bacterium]